MQRSPHPAKWYLMVPVHRAPPSLSRFYDIFLSVIDFLVSSSGDAKGYAGEKRSLLERYKVSDTNLRRLIAPTMAHCMFAAVVTGLLLSPILVWFARVPYARLFAAIRTKAATQPKGSNLRQILALMPFLLAIFGLSVCYSFPISLKWYYGAASLFRMDIGHRLCVLAYFVAFLLSSAASIWWIGGLQAFRPPGYDPNNPNPDPDEWRWKG